MMAEVPVPARTKKQQVHMRSPLTEKDLDLVLDSIDCVLMEEKKVDVHNLESKQSIEQIVYLQNSEEKKAVLLRFCLELLAVLRKTLSHFGRVREDTAKERAQTLFYMLTKDEIPDVWKHGCAQLGLSVVNVHQQQSVNRVLFEIVLIMNRSHDHREDQVFLNKKNFHLMNAMLLDMRLDIQQENY